ncbi:MAG: hypothetical protein AB8F95_02255 [Bacteroidia bacterium]
MNKEEAQFHAVGENIPEAAKGQLFGKPCYKLNGKAFCCFFKNEMVFKLTGEDHQEALSFDGAQLFDPSGKGRPMKEWVQLPYDYQEHWTRFAESAAEYLTQKNK